jgi:hypothetical protein
MLSEQTASFALYNKENVFWAVRPRSLTTSDNISSLQGEIIEESRDTKWQKNGINKGNVQWFVLCLKLFVWNCSIQSSKVKSRGNPTCESEWFWSTNTECQDYRYTKIHALVLVPKSFMKFMFSTVYRVTKKYFYARPYTSMWAPVGARQISKRYSSSCHVFISIQVWGVISSTTSIIRCLKQVPTLKCTDVHKNLF